jgi:hypothetical protein
MESWPNSIAAVMHTLQCVRDRHVLAVLRPFGGHESLDHARGRIGVFGAVRQRPRDVTEDQIHSRDLRVFSAMIGSGRVAQTDRYLDVGSARNAQSATYGCLRATGRRRHMEFGNKIAGGDEDSAAADAVEDVVVRLLGEDIRLGVFTWPEIVATFAPVLVRIGIGGDPPAAPFAQH